MEERTRYNDFANFLALHFPFKVQKISLNVGFTCPNRDGVKGYGGCTYCNNQTFNPAYCRTDKSVTEQLEEGKAFFARKYPEMRYLAYFQAYTNTYAELEKLQKMYEDALRVKGVVGLVIGTRPDCMPEELLDYLEDLNRRTFLLVEYGIESTDNRTLQRINRGHTFECTADAVKRTAERGIRVGGHVILGLPGEDHEAIIRQAAQVSELPLTTLKMHQLQLVRGTRMAREYEVCPEDFHLYEVDEYIDLVIDYLERVRPDLVLERFVSQSPKELLIAPDWGIKNYEFAVRMKRRLQERDTWQGKFYNKEKNKNNIVFLINRISMEIKGKVHYVGVNDRTKALFENLWPLPYGVSYNSYLIADDDMVALVDTVDVAFFEVYIKKIRSIIGDRKINYLIINHMEPDHSGSIALIKKYYPEIVLVGNKKTFDMVEGYYGVTGERYVVGEGDFLKLGHHNLRFYLVPMVHWPETMVTFDETEGILFSGDAFGCFGALNGGCIDRNINTDIYWNEMRRYYANIVGKFGNPVQKALQKCGGLPIKMICPTHGPVWEEYIPKVVDMYDKMSRYEGEEGVVIAYGTMYGNTEELAETIAEELSAQGIKNIVLHNVSHTPHSYILADIFKYKGLIAGCTTYNMQLYPEMESLLNKVAAREMKNRLFGYFGSFTWASAAVKKLGEFTEKLKFEVVGNPIEMKQSMKADNYAQAKELAKAMADRLKADRK